MRICSGAWNSCYIAWKGRQKCHSKVTRWYWIFSDGNPIGLLLQKGRSLYFHALKKPTNSKQINKKQDRAKKLKPNKAPWKPPQKLVEKNSRRRTHMLIVWNIHQNLKQGQVCWFFHTVPRSVIMVISVLQVLCPVSSAAAQALCPFLLHIFLFHVLGFLIF